MAHALSIRQTGKAEMAYVGKTPWHKLGQQLPPGASLEVWSQAAGMDWMIESSPVQFTVNGQMHEMPDRVVLYRSDNQFALSSVSRWYKPVHPGEVLGFFRDLTDAAGLPLRRLAPCSAASASGHWHPSEPRPRSPTRATR